MNVFHGRLHDGKAFIGGLELEVPEHGGRSADSATVYVRPHEIDLGHDGDGLHAEVKHITPAGAVVRVVVRIKELDREASIDVPRERFGELGLSRGDGVYVSPKRARVFVQEPVMDYAI